MDNTTNNGAAASAVAPRIEINADGSQTIIGPNGESTLIVPNAPGGGSEENLSPAMRMLKDLCGDGPPIKPIRTLISQGNPWHIQRLKVAGISKVGLLTPRDEEGNLNLLSEEDAGSLMASVLFCCVVTGAEDHTPFFGGFTEAWVFANSLEEKPMQTVSDLFFGALAHNPSLMPDIKRLPVDWEGEPREKKDLRSTQSSTLSTTSVPDSSSDITSSDALAE